MIRLHMNEMPFLPPNFVLEAAEKGIHELNRYADHAKLHTLKKLLAQYSGVPEKHIVVSPGSDILLRELIISLSKDRKLVMTSPSFLPTVQAATHFARKIVRLRLAPPEFYLESALIIEELNEPSLVIIENPNNPTGRLLINRETLEAALKSPETLCVIDEAYFEFSGFTFADMVPQYPNLAVIRTMDKSFSLAGARVGYLLAGDLFLDAFSSFNAFLPRPSLNAAIAALEKPDYKDDYLRFIIEAREKLGEFLKESGLSICKSETNFLLVQTGRPDVVERLRERDILVADVSSQLPPGSFRVSIGTPEENKMFACALREILKS